MARSDRAAAVFLLLIAACGFRDEADREYFAALAGDKVGKPCEEMIRHLDRAIELRQDRASYYQHRAGYRVGLRDLAGAKADIDRAIALTDQPYLRYERAIIVCKSGRCAEALHDLDAAIATQPENTQFYRVRAIARVAAGMPEKALEDGERTVAQMPQSGESYYARGVARLALGQAQAALADLDTTLKLRPELVYPLTTRADAYQKLGDATRAATDRAEAARRSQGNDGCRGCGVCADPLHP
jgi:tetratricopeptide (TPR) repeat protein